ncbi:hypothetical protein [Streptacidiphilus sp. EB129]|jgi:hypothetical protein|uniref:hypothetical protein n=1 Tax=Streptacidiphilus sp. EB129 TaxID=3156262 RepID=UPI00351518D3
MAVLVVDGQDLVLRLSLPERLAARRAEVRVPLLAVRGISVERSAWRALRGVPVSGTSVPGWISLGVRRFPVGQDFAAVRASRPALCVDLGRGTEFARLAVSVRDPDATAVALRSAAGL